MTLSRLLPFPLKEAAAPGAQRTRPVSPVQPHCRPPACTGCSVRPAPAQGPAHKVGSGWRVDGRRAQTMGRGSGAASGRLGMALPSSRGSTSTGTPGATWGAMGQGARWPDLGGGPEGTRTALAVLPGYKTHGFNTAH